MQRVRLSILFFLIGMSYYAIAQQKRLDSLLVINNGYHKQDSLKAVYLKDVFRAYANLKNYPKFRIYADSAVLIAAALPDKSSLAYIYQRMGVVFHISDRLQSITYYRKSIEIAKTADAVKIEAGSYLNLGALYLSISDYAASLDAHERALALYLSIGDKDQMTSCYMNIADIYTGMNQHVKSMEYARKALALFEIGKNYRGVSVACDVIGSTYLIASDKELMEMGIEPANRFRKASESFDKGLKAALLVNDKGLIATFFSDFGRLNDMLGKKEVALQYFLKAQDMSKNEESDREIYLDNLITSGIFYLKKMNEIEKGSGLLYQALILSQQITRLGSQLDIFNALSDMHANKRNFDSALYYYRKAIIIRDSISNQEKEKEITRKQLKLDFGIKEREYKETQQLTDAKLKQQVLLAGQQERELLVRKQQLEISNKEKSLQRLKFLQKQVEFENAQKLQSARLTRKELEKKLETHTRDQKINEQQQQISFTKKLTLFMEILLFILSIAAFAVYKAKQRMAKLNTLVSAQKDELQELGKVKDKIFSIVSHDMRAPVNHLVAFSSLLEEGEIEQEKLAKYIEQIKGTLEHTSSMMENLLNWAASQMHGFTPVMEAVNLSPILQDIINGLAPNSHKKNISFRNSVMNDVLVSGDKNMVELIIRNLLSNSIKFSGHNSAVEIFSNKGKDNTVSLSIKDQGVGISEAKVNLINASSVRSLESTYGTDKEKGTGLGLMLCKHFAFLMKGNISVESKEESGSVFTISLPAL